MPTFILQNCLRQLKASETLREHLQTLFHLNEDAERVPLARSTYSDALSSKARLHILEQTATILAESAAHSLPDRLAGIDGLKDRPVYAMDGTYQKESCHYEKLTPSEGGTDSAKGH